MKAVRRILQVTLGAVIAFTALSFLLPSWYEVERSIVIAAPPERVHPVLDDLHRWREWSSWSARDPRLRIDYTGPNQGVDSHMAWDGALGSGELTITASDPERGVWMDLLMEGRFATKAAVLLEPVDEGTRVTWITRGAVGKNPIWRFTGLMMERLLGPDFEANLTGIKALVEEARAEAP
jgi:hypothetical protein